MIQRIASNFSKQELKKKNLSCKSMDQKISPDDSHQKSSPQSPFSFVFKLYLELIQGM